MCVEEGLGLTVGFQINLHFQYIFQENIQICGNYMHVHVHVAAQWSTAGSFRASKQLNRKADCWTEANPNKSKKTVRHKAKSWVLYVNFCEHRKEPVNVQG